MYVNDCPAGLPASGKPGRAASALVANGGQWADGRRPLCRPSQTTRRCARRRRGASVGRAAGIAARVVRQRCAAIRARLGSRPADQSPRLSRGTRLSRGPVRFHLRSLRGARRGLPVGAGHHQCRVAGRASSSAARDDPLRLDTAGQYFARAAGWVSHHRKALKRRF